MKKLLNLSLLIILFLSSFTVLNFAQEKGSPQTTPTPVEDDEVVKITTKLVQFDTIVTDKNGNQVEDLTVSDFEILQDGKPQEITNFAYVKRENPVSAQSKEVNKKSLPLPPISLRSGQGRIITFIIDDGNCLSTPEGVQIARDGVRNFINEQMLSNDKVAIYRTRGGNSLLQMYTSNKEILKRVVDKVNWFPSGCGSTFDSTRNESTAKIPPAPERNQESKGTFESKEDEQFKSDAATFERNNQFKNLFQFLSFVIDRLKVLSQRKTVFFISEGIPFNQKDNTLLSALKELSDKASRSSVVFYTISEKGLTIPGMIEARDEVGGDKIIQARIEEERSLNNGLFYLADQTGGKFIRTKNFIDTDIKKILDLESGYYLIGYQPAGETFNGKEFHEIQIKIKRADLKVLSRKGFYGRDEKENKTKYKNNDSPLYQAIVSPFQENGIDIRLTTLTGHEAKTGSYIRALLSIAGKDLILMDDANGMKKTVLDVVAILLDEKGKVIEEFNRTYPIRIPPQGVEIVKRYGLDYSTELPVKNPGFYSLRLAVRDGNSKRLASAGDYVEVPDYLRKNKFIISGLTTTDVTKNSKPLMPKSRMIDAAFSPVLTTTVSSVRQYKKGLPFAYIYDIYNAEIDKKNNQPKLTIQLRLFKNGKLIVEEKEKMVEIEGQAGMSNIHDYGFLRLNENAEAGEYILQVIVKDSIANKTSMQWVDFEVIK